MRDLIITLFGEYSPVTYEVSEGVQAVASGAAGIDWTWIAGVLLFAIVLWSFFRLVGVLLSHG